jgi:SAM-dependent methyltransferase
VTSPTGPGALSTVWLRDDVAVAERGGIYVDARWKGGGVGRQFAEDAETFHALRIVDFTTDLARCFGLAGVGPEVRSVLDIGSGSGGSVLAAAKLLPEATFVACDISPELLSVLAALAARDERLRDRLILCCFDLEQPFFEPNQFDLIVGWAVLHHLVDPYAALRNVCESLRPGGKLVLNEPMEAGCMILAAMYERCLGELARLGDRDGPLVRQLEASRKDLQHRLGVPVPQSWTPILDDKWLFTEPYLMELGERLGFSRVEMHPVELDLANLYEGCFRSELFASGNGAAELPPSVIAIMREFDRGIAPELKRKLSPAGFVIFTK